jgi:hypothetical protein
MPASAQPVEAEAKVTCSAAAAGGTFVCLVHVAPPFCVARIAPFPAMSLTDRPTTTAVDEGDVVFILSVARAIAVIFRLGLVVVALVSTQTAASVVGGVLFFALMFLSGLWVQPDVVGGPLQVIMLYSPSGAAVRALLYSVFGEIPPVTILVALVGYALVFGFVAVRYFRWE